MTRGYGGPAEAARLRAAHTALPIVTVWDHEHQWAPWYNVYFGADYVPGDKEFSNGRGCLICRTREPERDEDEDYDRDR